MSDYRTTPEDVRAELEADSTIGDVEVISDSQIETVGIVPANLEVDERLADAGMSADRLALIERYLAGHFILSSGIDELRQLDRESLDDGSSYDYAGDRDRDDYGSTSLGQKAIAMDASGRLANANKPPATVRSPNSRGPQRGRGRGRR
ncbi:hypothetical protein [Natrarchaeobaculum sulfurireducens]|uniref:Uncharacterized protein n=1 Tax=Natrarchaeobaculum sulfurireducens TaxID=2044521 RepID=A0A346PMP5_9EURY|nr:hypothetical protein [Natrarchaeobaculum sulfurireducens]AXR80790.1 hypothetical protein AArcMg_0768 [Natrarchaeobaculum sulfurireducens]